MLGEVEIGGEAESLVSAYSKNFLLYSAGQEFFRTASVDDLLATLGVFSCAKDVSLMAHVIYGSHAFFDSIYSLIIEQLCSSGCKVHCEVRCSSCCKQVVVSNPFEAALIGIALSGSARKRAAFDKNYARWDAETSLMRPKFSGWVEQQMTHNVDDMSFDHVQFTARCPFLVDDLCQIYHLRPYSCRSYLALSDKCKHPDDPKQKPGRQGIGIGMSTVFHRRRSQLLSVLWNQFGVNAAKTRGHFLPDLVKCYLDGDIEKLFGLCLLR